MNDDDREDTHAEDCQDALDHKRTLAERGGDPDDLKLDATPGYDEDTEPDPWDLHGDGMRRHAAEQFLLFRL